MTDSLPRTRFRVTTIPPTPTTGTKGTTTTTTTTTTARYRVAHFQSQSTTERLCLCRRNNRTVSIPESVLTSSVSVIATLPPKSGVLLCCLAFEVRPSEWLQSVGPLERLWRTLRILPSEENSQVSLAASVNVCECGFVCGCVSVCTRILDCAPTRMVFLRRDTRFDNTNFINGLVHQCNSHWGPYIGKRSCG